MNGSDLIRKERTRQRREERFSHRHDDRWTHEELARAAVCYAMPPYLREEWSGLRRVIWPGSRWPWRPSSLRAVTSPHTHSGDRIRELVKAGALIAAEIDRLQREAAR